MIKSLAQLAFVTGLMILFVFCLMPSADMPDIGTSDKVMHGLAYVLLGISGRLAFPSRRSLPVLFLGLISIGIAIELAQLAVPGRSAEFADGIADLLGTAIGLGIGEALRHPIRRLASGAAAS